MKRVRYINKDCNCIGHVINKEDGDKYYLLQGSNLRNSYDCFETKEKFLDTLSNWMIYIAIDEINLNSRFAWAKKDEFVFLSDTLMETE